MYSALRYQQASSLFGRYAPQPYSKFPLFKGLNCPIPYPSKLVHRTNFGLLSFIFKCLCDTVILDDFKTALDHMRNYWLRKQASGELLLSTRLKGRPPRNLQRSDDLEAAEDNVTHQLVRSDKSFSVPRVVLRDSV